MQFVIVCHYFIIYTREIAALVGAMKFLLPAPVFSPQLEQ